MVCTSKSSTWTVLLLLAAGISGAASAYDSGNILGNGGFENGDLSEAANDAMGSMPWMTSNTKNSIAASKAAAHTGQFGLEWNPIGWNVKQDGTLEDGGVFIINACAKHLAAGARKVRVAGFANTSALASGLRLQVVLANGSFKNIDFSTGVAGGAQGWQRFEASLALDASDTALFLAFLVPDTKGKGAPGSAVYVDDLELSYSGPGDASQPAAAAETPAPGTATRPFLMGFTPFAWDLDEEAANRSMEFVVTHGDIICHHFDGGVPWTEALSGAPLPDALQKDWEKRKAGVPPEVKVYLALTPVSGMRNGMALYRGEKENMPLPEAFQNKKFSDPVIKTAYFNYCKRAADFFNPDYFAIGIEVNEIRHTAPDQWADLVELHRYVREELKKTHPTLPIFATLTLHNLLNKEWKDIEQERESIKAFLPLNDIAGVSFYSFFSCLGPAEKPMESFDWVKIFVGDKPIAICETAFPAEPTKLSWAGSPIELPGSLEGQESYYETLLTASARDNYLFVITFLYRDYDQLWEKIKATTPDWAGAWKDTGLLNGDGESRPAWQAWERYRALKYERPRP